jgi:hypothetical protein
MKCQIATCKAGPGEATGYPNVVLILRDGQRCDLVVGLRVCDACRVGITRTSDVLDDDCASIVDTLRIMGQDLASKHLEWAPVDHPAAQWIERTRPS